MMKSQCEANGMSALAKWPARSSGGRLLPPNQPAEGPPLLKRPRSGQRLRSHFQRRHAPPLARSSGPPVQRRSPGPCAPAFGRAPLRGAARPCRACRRSAGRQGAPRSPARPCARKKRGPACFVSSTL
ncbi:hypothetical protein PVAP13_9NG047373 [Panicum virgatum]|uniref:Uncharacterized protein n=1 Tax=Panicum virgatum TaxID=38727 RepID=A0A8T0MEE5_PANVG|nr:hypothetical protein PVAP13_9NG047373 [Panicum virgatum]